jgi:eukaryotic-like serine/threonine-protein kinase
LFPKRTQPYANLAVALMSLNRFAEAKGVYEQAMAQGLDSTGFHWGLYQTGFAQNDAALMQQQINWLAGKSNEYEAVDWQAKTSAFAGQLKKARELSSHAVELANRGNLKEVAGQFITHAALREAAAGKCQPVAGEVNAALTLARTNTTVVEGALILALCGDSNQAMAIINEQYRRFPKDTWVNMVWLPSVRAIVELRRNNPATAIQLLQMSQAYETGYVAAYWPMYIRGLAYLQNHSGAQAAAEFQKIIKTGGVNMNTNLYALAHIGLARGLAISADKAQSRKAYEDFFKLWKDADADIPVLQEARREYEKLN